jgi:Icc protein
MTTPITVVVPGDLHLTDRGLANHRAAERMIDEVNHLIRPDFVQFIGDNVQDATDDQFRLFLELAGRLESPHYALVGDHDVKDDPRAERFRRYVGDPSGSNSVGGFRFIRLNTREARPVGLSSGQVDWFTSEVDSALERGERCVVFQHNYPFKIWEDYDGPGIDGWREVVQTRRIEAIVCGHTHYWQVANDGRNPSIAVRSIGDPEGGPPGYAILHLAGDDLAVKYRPVDEGGPIAMVIHPRDSILATSGRHVVRGHDQLLTRVWSTLPVASAVARVDDGDWFDLEQSGEGYWGHPLNVDRLFKGEHAVEVRVVDAEGRAGDDRIEFMVDATGRYTPVPRVRPVVTETAFC